MCDVLVRVYGNLFRMCDILVRVCEGVHGCAMGCRVLRVCRVYGVCGVCEGVRGCAACARVCRVCEGVRRVWGE